MKEFQYQLYACVTLVVVVAIVWYLGHLSAMDVAITTAVVRAIVDTNVVNAMRRINAVIGTTASQTGAFKGAANRRGPLKLEDLKDEVDMNSEVEPGCIPALSCKRH